MGLEAISRLLLAITSASFGADTAQAAEGLRARVDFTRSLEPQPGSASDAVIGFRCLFVSDRMDSALLRYDESGKEVARYQKEGSGPGSLRGHVALAAAGDTLFAWSSRGALMRFNSRSLALEREDKTGMAGAAGRFFRQDGRFYLAGPGWAGDPDALDYFWTESDPPSAKGEGRSVIWRLKGDGIGARAMDLAFRPLVTRIPGGGFLVLRFDRYEVARIDRAGRLVEVLSLAPPRTFRARARAFAREDVSQRDRSRYFRWLGEASVLVAPVALGTERVGVVRMELGTEGVGPPRWYMDVYDRNGRPRSLDVPLPVTGRHLLGIQGLTSTSFEGLEMTKDFLEPGSEHRWIRFALSE